MTKDELLGKIMCVPATIRKCDGFIIEAVTDEPNKSEILEALKILQSRGYTTHGLSGSNDNEPKEIYRGSVLKADKFGWFVTRNKMEFPSNALQSNVLLSSRNRTYYRQEKKGRFGLVLTKCKDYEDAIKVSVAEMLQDKPIMKELNFITNGIECIKEIRMRYRKKES